MVYRRRAPRRRRRRTRRTTRTRTSTRRPSRTVGKLTESSTYKFKRSLLYQTISPTAAPLATFGGFAFRLSDIPSPTDFGNLFDQYMLTGVKLNFIPQMTDNTSTSTNAGTFLYYYDYDDATSTGLTLDTFYQKMSLKMRQSANRPFSLFIRPKASMSAVSSVSGNQVAQLPVTWLDMISPDAIHYGIKWAWANCTTTTISMAVYATYYFKMRGVQ